MLFGAISLFEVDFLSGVPIGAAPGTGVPIGNPRVGVPIGAAPGTGVPIGDHRVKGFRWGGSRSGPLGRPRWVPREINLGGPRNLREICVFLVFCCIFRVFGVKKLIFLFFYYFLDFLDRK